MTLTAPGCGMGPVLVDEVKARVAQVPFVTGVDVELVFDRPVRVQGTVELYVLEPQTGGWGLPLLGGSGTDTLIFDADAEGNPALIVGESQIAGFTFPDQESKLTDLDGTSVNYNIEPWTYE